MAILGIDVGGTFTDAVLLDGGELRTAKVPTARNQEESVLAAAAAVGAGELERFTHGTTIATNALLERRGARTALVATEGFEHVLHLRRQDRAHLYRLCAQHPEPLVPLERSFGVRGRIGPEGELAPLDLGSLPDLGDAEAIAVCLLFSFRDPRHERAVADGAAAAASERARRRLARDRRRSSASTSAPRQRRRTPTSARCSAATCTRSAARCEDAGLPEPLVMRSSGGVAPIDEAAAHPRGALLSGPAAGVVGASARRAARGDRERDRLRHGRHLDRRLRDRRRRGDARRASGSSAGCRFALPTLDVHTVGAGGGSIVWRDAGGALRVGPESAGAEPGPACYGRGGELPTVTDANLLLGRLPDRARRRARARPRRRRARARDGRRASRRT